MKNERLTKSRTNLTLQILTVWRFDFELNNKWTYFVWIEWTRNKANPITTIYLCQFEPPHRQYLRRQNWWEFRDSTQAILYILHGSWLLVHQTFKIFLKSKKNQQNMVKSHPKQNKFSLFFSLQVSDHHRCLRKTKYSYSFSQKNSDSLDSWI